MLYLQFYVDGDRYIINTRHILSVIPLLKMHKAAAYRGGLSSVCGHIHYNGQTIPVVDLNNLISGKKSKPYLSTRIVLTDYMPDKTRREIVGLMVKKATEVIKLTEANFADSSIDSIRNGVKNSGENLDPFLGPMAKDSHGLLQQLNIHQVIEQKVINDIHMQASFIE